jgi:hypothetical protein
MALLSTFLDKHYPHDEMVKQRKKQKGISVASSSELLPLKSILEVLLNKSMRPDPYVTIDDQVSPSSPPSLSLPLPLFLSALRLASRVLRSGGTGTWSCSSGPGSPRRTAATAAGAVESAALRPPRSPQRCRIRLVDFLK